MNEAKRAKPKAGRGQVDQNDRSRTQRLEVYQRLVAPGLGPAENSQDHRGGREQCDHPGVRPPPVPALAEREQQGHQARSQQHRTREIEPTAAATRGLRHGQEDAEKGQHSHPGVDPKQQVEVNMFGNEAGQR